MKVFVTGANGQLGYDVMNEIYKRGYEGLGSDRSGKYVDIADDSPVTAMSFVPLDITEAENVAKVLEKIRPDAVIHCAAWTASDGAEDEENKSKVYAININGTQNIANACKKINAKMVYISSDYVFDGTGTDPWPAEGKEPKPLNVYGITKRGGELAVSNTLDRFFIVRTAWVFGVNGKNFVRTMLDIGKTQESVCVVNDQIGTPTYSIDLARLLVDMIETEKYGYYHATNEGGYISWYDFTCEIYHMAGYINKVIPVSTEEYGLCKAERPRNSRLDKSKLRENGFKPLPNWKDALSRYLTEIQINK